MSDNQFTKLFKYIKKCFDQTDARFDQQDQQIADLKGVVGELGGQLRHYHQEMIMPAS